MLVRELFIPSVDYLLELRINSNRRCNSAWNLAVDRLADSPTCSRMAWSISSVGSCKDASLYDLSSCCDISLLIIVIYFSIGYDKGQTEGTGQRPAHQMR